VGPCSWIRSRGTRRRSGSLPVGPHEDGEIATEDIEENLARVGPTTPKPSMRGPLSSEAVQILGRGLPHIPFAVGFGRSGPSQTGPRARWSCHPHHLLLARGRGRASSLDAGCVRSFGRPWRDLPNLLFWIPQSPPSPAQ